MNLPTPQSLPEFQQTFATEEACQDYLFALRWPNGFKCPCSSNRFYWHRSRRLVKCAGCNIQTYITAGTIMHRSHTPLTTWFYGAFFTTTLTPGISATQFQRQLGLSRYETAFQILHKIRAAMINPAREQLSGLVEVDETFVGGVRAGRETGGRSVVFKTAVVGAVEVHGREEGGTYAGRLRLRVIPQTTGTELTQFITDVVERGSRVHTDGWGGYNDLRSMGYRHQAEVGSANRSVLPLIHREFANLKTWLAGTHHHRVERQHLQTYLNEFTFRHNRRFWPFSAFERVLSLGISWAPQTYEELYNADEYGRNIHVGGLEA